ncbi:hypothetical protein [Dactylosporangium sp. NPDC051541]|uniref:hypothetical protein n=1 Tax=Dactylosporangium sp. NPDC051541 TaxID=3363977 RepID=UPI0037B42B80
MTYLAAGVGELHLGPRIARGREGTVFRVAGLDRVLAKIYRRPDAWLEPRLTAAIAQPPARWRAEPDGHRYVAWPQSVVYDAERRAVGFLMFEVLGVPLVQIYEADTRAEALDDPTWARCVWIARELAAIFAALHPSIVVGDVSPNNVLVTRAGRVCLIDCDSMQFPDRASGQIWRAPMATADYAPYSPGGPAQVLTPAHDHFGLAILICELLMAGQHPYDGRPVGAARAEGKAGNIRLGANRVTNPASLGARPGLIPPIIMPARIRRLLKEAFADQTHAPTPRPTAAMWVQALDTLAENIAACGHSVYHRYPRELRQCVWCAQVSAGAGDYFPPPAHPRTPPPAKPKVRTVRAAPPDYGHKPKKGTPPLPDFPAPRTSWRDG